MTFGSGEPLVEQAPAKINLALHVTGRRQDGYHTIESLFVFASVGDELTARPGNADGLVVTGPFGVGLEAGPNNLVNTAVRRFRERFPGAVREGVALTLSKTLPIASGLGGGSADAAAALRLMARLSNERIETRDLLALAVGIGADVPACLLSAPLVARGIGEELAVLRDFPACHVVLVNPLVSTSTPEVFSRLEHRENASLPDLPEPMTRPAQLGLWLEATRNDLERPARKLVPAIGPIAARMGETAGCMLARMSGSGATVFGLFSSQAQSHQAASDMRNAFPAHWVAAAPLLVPGA